MVCPSVTISLWPRGESTWSWFWAAMSSILGVDRTAPTASTFGEDRGVLDRRPFELLGVSVKQFE